MRPQYTETVFSVNHGYTNLDIPRAVHRGDYAAMEFSANLKRYREMRNWNQAELGERVGVAQATIQRWETGKREPKHADLEKLAEALEVSVSALFREPWEAPLPTREELARIIDAAMKELPFGVSYDDYPEAVSSGVYDRLALFQASGGFRARQAEETASDTVIRSAQPTKQGAPAKPRIQ